MDKYRIIVKGIVKCENRYLVVKKWYDDRVSEPYQWQFIDGEVEFGEALEKAVLRNIFEQTGIAAVVDRVLYTWTFMTGDIYNIGISFLCLTSEEHVFLSEELVDYHWIEKNEFDQYIEAKVLEDIRRTQGI